MTCTRPDYSNLTPTMTDALDLLEACWVEAEENDAPILAWTYGINANTVAALRRRGFDIMWRRDYYGDQYRMPDPHPSGLGW